MDVLRAMQAYVNVVEEGGFAAAARQSGLSKAMTSSTASAST